ncbi:hypothetical protein Q9L58_009402 [Maublancomyces gigas]|uniref:Uncharacterized protein n=1 Tax=Discina gigas TaxID=1032678 RepID=A0ABR3G6Z8_9PEZI
MSQQYRTQGRGPKNIPKRGPPLRTQVGRYPALTTFFGSFPSFTRDTSQPPDDDFRRLQYHHRWDSRSDIYAAKRRQFLLALAAETKSPVHAFFVQYAGFLDYNSAASPHVEFVRLQRRLKGYIAREDFDAAFRAEFNGPLDRFFRRYPEFKYNPRGTHMAEFRRLVAAKRWDPERAKREQYAKEEKSIAYNRARAAFFDGFRGEFDHLFGADAKDFGTWRKLCRTLGVQPMPSDVEECKKVTGRLMVNIYDITHHKRTGAPFDFFNTLDDLRSYTQENKLYFPKDRAKESALRFLLRQILPKMTRLVKHVVR